MGDGYYEIQSEKEDYYFVDRDGNRHKVQESTTLWQTCVFLFSLPFKTLGTIIRAFSDESE